MSPQPANTWSDSVERAAAERERANNETFVSQEDALAKAREIAERNAELMRRLA